MFVFTSSVSSETLDTFECNTTLFLQPRMLLHWTKLCVACALINTCDSVVSFALSRTHRKNGELNNAYYVEYNTFIQNNQYILECTIFLFFR